MEERHARNGKLFNSLEHARATGRAHVVCLGDSHLFVFREDLPPTNAAHLMSQAWFDPCLVIGATAQGLANPFSQTNSLNIFRYRVGLAETWQQIVFQLGEVDCGFLIWYRAANHGDSVEKQFQLSIQNYVAFVREVRSQGFEKLFVLSAPLPTIKDGQDSGDVAHARRSIDISQRDRTEMTLRYNEELAREADGYTFIDVTGPTVDRETGLVAQRFLNEDPKNHHLASEPYGRLIADRLGPLLTAP